MPNPQSSPHFKSIFQSKTFWGAVLTLAAAVAPAIGEIVTEKQETGRLNANKITNIVVILATTGLTITGRVGATDRLYTPDGLPGPNESDLSGSDRP